MGSPCSTHSRFRRGIEPSAAVDTRIKRRAASVCRFPYRECQSLIRGTALDARHRSLQHHAHEREAFSGLRPCATAFRLLRSNDHWNASAQTLFILEDGWARLRSELSKGPSSPVLSTAPRSVE